MKKTSFTKLCLLFVLVVLTLIQTTTFTSAQSRFLPGDVNDDRQITEVDARLVLKHFVGLVTLTNLKAADFNCDGNVDVTDARSILRLAKTLEDIQTSIQAKYATQPAVSATTPTVTPTTVPTTIPTTTPASTSATTPATTQLTGTGDWNRAYMTYFSSEEGGGENFDTSLVGNVLLLNNGYVVPNYSKGFNLGADNIVTFYGYNVLGTTNRSILPMGSVVEYRVAGRYFQGVVLDNNGDNMGGRSLVTMDHLFITNSDGENFIESLISPWEYLPICEYRIIGKINTSTGEVVQQ